MRKVLHYSKKILFVTNFLKKEKVSFNSNSVSHFRNYISFHHYAAPNLSNSSFQFFNKIAICQVDLRKFKSKRKKFYTSQIRFWLNDFYLDSKSFDSIYSSTMIHCSKFLRLNTTNFKF